MALYSELDTRFCAVWETNMSRFRSRCFSLLDYNWVLHVSYDGADCTISLINDTYLDFATYGFGVTTFIEKITSRSPVLETTFTPIPSLPALSYKVIWNRSSVEILQRFPGFFGCEFRIVCVFHGVPSTTIQCNKKTVTADKYVQATLDLSPDLESLSLDLCNLLDNKGVPDMKLRCGDRTISVHKAVLAARSEVFAAMFQNKMLESETGVVDIIDLDAPVLELFLKYVYSGKMSSVSDDVVPSLYAAGDKYAVHALKRACSERMAAGLSKENFLRFLTMADAHSDEVLKETIVNFVVKHMEVLRSEAWSTFKEEHPKLAIHVMTIFIHQKHFS